MIRIHDDGVYWSGGAILSEEEGRRRGWNPEMGRSKTISYGILAAHNTAPGMDHLELKFDAVTSHDITYVSIIQTARASGMDHFPIPYVLTCCHNSLCAVGGTINEDDHLFGLSAAKKFGGIYVPPHLAVIHQYMRERMAGGGKMILGSDSHTRYGALGTLSIGEGGGELVKQLLGEPYEVEAPEVIAIYLTGRPAPWVGPMDVALSIIRAVFKTGYVKNKIMEFIGPGIASMSTDYRNGIDVMTTETACLSSVWATDEETRDFLRIHGREEEYRSLDPQEGAYYDGCVEVDLSAVKPMIAMPYHPSNAFEIDELYENLDEILAQVEEDAAAIAGGQHLLTLRDKVGSDGTLQVQQAVIAGCAGGNYTNVVEAAHLLKDHPIGNDAFSLSVYPSSQAVYLDLDRKGLLADLMASGAVVRTAFCGPCFGAGDIPGHNSFSIRHTTRNFPNRDGSKPGEGQMIGVALMDARSIAATCLHGGKLTSAEGLDGFGDIPPYHFDDRAYQARVFQGFGKGKPELKLQQGPNIKEWPEMEPLGEHVLLEIVSKIEDEVTTTDELIPSGETASYRSNPLQLAEFALSRRDPDYVGRAKETKALEMRRLSRTPDERLDTLLRRIHTIAGQEGQDWPSIEIGSAIYANKPGDGSAREQAASSQRILGGLANIVQEYATKRYRSNCINWGMLPFHLEEDPSVLSVGDFVYVPGIRSALDGTEKTVPAYVLHADGAIVPIALRLQAMSKKEVSILRAGSLINEHRAKRKDLP